MADQDHDGSHIKGLLINFLHSFWPSLLKVLEFLLEFITPIVKATQKNSNNVISFYNMPEYEAWKDSLGRRAKYFKIKSFLDGIYFDSNEKHIPYLDFINKELILFSMADLQRSIPSTVGGLKPTYHHGEQSLVGTIIGMAQNFVGSNNINLLYPSGQFGTCQMGPRLEYLSEDGQSVEPTWYLPIIPMVLVNGSEGIGTRWSTFIPNYNPRDIIANLKHEDENTLRITEFPVRRWTQEYKEFLVVASTAVKDKEPFIEEYNAHNDDTTVNFQIIMTADQMSKARQEGLLKKFKLTTTLSTISTYLKLWSVFYAARKPLVAAIDGPAFGGGLEITLACLPRLVGLPKALEMILMSKRVNGKDAFSMSLVDVVAPAEELIRSASRWGLDISEARKPWIRSLYRTDRLEALKEASCRGECESQLYNSSVTTRVLADKSLKKVLLTILLLCDNQASVELQGIKGMWSLRSATDDIYDTFLVVSFISETRILAVNLEDELEETEIEGFCSQVQTLFCHDAICNQLVQVTSSSVRLVSSSSGELRNEWHAPNDYSINVATVNATPIFSLPDLNLITEEHLGGEIIPRSVLLCAFEGIP
ncbi:unnamed protein product [Lactuca virosa]|uniref:DNA topoisomerase (ATP-hydrolyzing) n=1 Tax=Lactuca virosa TaxID=75947 RepID=A0AAU9PV37_9ASTR|nr:unnamed protein product [Lactuca virosa]